MPPTLQAGGMSAEQAAEAAHKNHDEFKTRAEKRAHSCLIIDAMADQEKIEVSDEEVAERVAVIVTQAGRDRERVANFYSKEENRAALAQRHAARKDPRPAAGARATRRGRRSRWRRFRRRERQRRAVGEG